MKICFSNQMKRLDEISIKVYGIPGIVLMENAGLAVLEEINKLSLAEKSADIICGIGNNGGDGFVIARHLFNIGWKVDVWLCGEAAKIKGDALINFMIIKKTCIPVHEVDNVFDEAHEKLVFNKSVIVDALLGTGYRGTLRGLYKSIADKVNSSKAYTVSVDIPSGLDADTGFTDEGCINADCTVTFQLPKAGLLINDGPKACGTLKVKDISIPKAAISSMELPISLLEREMIEDMLPQRAFNTHKGSFGRVFVAACSRGMEGSGIISAKAALRSGAGTVLLGLPESLQKPLTAEALEVMTRGLKDEGTGILAVQCIPQLLEAAEKSSVFLAGPGLTAAAVIRTIMTELIENCKTPMVIDADGLNAISQNTDILKKSKGNIVLTPHPGEMARLCGCSTADIQKDRLGHAVRFAREYNVIVVLKGFRTIIALPQGTAFINPTGNPGMATAGSGDVLAGIIAGLGAQGLNLAAAALCGAYIHGAAGDRVAMEIGEYGLTASDIIGNIPHTIKSIAGK